MNSMKDDETPYHPIQPIFFDEGSTLDPDKESLTSPLSQVVELFLAMLGTALNIFALMIMALSMRYGVSRSTAFFVSLAISDLLISSFTMTISSISASGKLTFNDPTYGKIQCMSVAVINVIAASSSSFTVVLIAVDRYFSVAYTAMLSIGKILGILALMWTLSLLIGIIPFVTGLIVLRDNTGDRCLIEMTPGYQITIATVLILIPCAVISFIYAKILRLVYTYRDYGEGGEDTPSPPRVTPSGAAATSFEGQINALGDPISPRSSTLHRRNTATLRISAFFNRLGSVNIVTNLTMTSLVLLFLAHWLPFGIINVVNAFNPGSISSQARRVCIWLLLANSITNPIVYVMSNPKFSAELEYFQCDCCKETTSPIRSNPEDEEFPSFMFPELFVLETNVSTTRVSKEYSEMYYNNMLASSIQA